ncbi:MAG: glycine cleavage system protein H [Thermoanaerobaculaceae bacterium]
MTAILVLVTIILAVALDVVLVKLGHRSVSPYAEQPEPMVEPKVPPGVFLSPNHVWLHLSTDGTVRMGADDFLCQLAGKVEGINVPPPGTQVKAGRPLFSIRLAGREISVPAPFPVEVISSNPLLGEKPYLLERDPYGVGWIVSVWIRDLKEALKGLWIGAQSGGFLRREMERLAEFLAIQPNDRRVPVLADGGWPIKGVLTTLNEDALQTFCQQFLQLKEG